MKVVQFFGTEQLQPGLMVTTRRTRRSQRDGPRGMTALGTVSGVTNRPIHIDGMNARPEGGREEGAEWGN